MQPRHDPGAGGDQPPPAPRPLPPRVKALLWLGIAVTLTAWIYLIFALWALITEMTAVLVWIASVAAGA